MTEPDTIFVNIGFGIVYNTGIPSSFVLQLLELALDTFTEPEDPRFRPKTRLSMLPPAA